MTIYKKLNRQKEYDSKREGRLSENRAPVPFHQKQPQQRKLDLFELAPTTVPRNVKASHEVRHILATLFERHPFPSVRDLQGNVISCPENLTIMDVIVSKDLLECTVYLSSLTQRDQILPYFDLATPLVRKEFAKVSPFRLVPHFRFKLADLFEHSIPLI